ncbi:carbonic anhydrase 2-like [Daphnia pulicaria]|uniref:carbonic anhydrase 2-like n=1 Tax=Daphnia pulicaria TaxID=35523 RepID=UPI001EEB0904|nr:carbonic anhydrase 2-like [Daphnia pulicaria]
MAENLLLLKHIILAFLVCSSFLQIVNNSPIRNVRPTKGKNHQAVINPNIMVRTHENPWIEHWEIKKQRAISSWSYTDPEAWQHSFPTCGSNLQSPINIETASLRAYPKFYFGNYGNIDRMTVTNNGHTVLFSLPSSIPAESIPFITGGGLSNRYNFVQFHFHWGNDSSHGSEHRIKSKKYSAELHLVHYNTKYGSFSEATKYDEGLAVLGVLIKVGKKINSAFRAVVDQLNEVDEDGDETTLVNLISFKDLLPSRTTTFFRYSGSFTTPGCEEIIIWTVFDDSITISESQLSKFRLLKGRDSLTLVNNYRPVQSLSGRTVTYRSHSGCHITINWSHISSPIVDIYQYSTCVFSFYANSFLTILGVNL